MDDDEEAKYPEVKTGETDKKQVWDEKNQPLKEDEELVFDNLAYQMLHRSRVEWPCLSIDFLLRDRIA